MKNFRIYVDNLGYEQYSLRQDIYEAKRDVGRLLAKDKRVLIIQHDTELDQDEVLTKDELFKMKTLGKP